MLNSSNYVSLTVQSHAGPSVVNIKVNGLHIIKNKAFNASTLRK